MLPTRQDKGGRRSIFTDFRVEDGDAFRRRVEAEPLPPTIFAYLDETANRYGDKAAWHFIDDGISRTWREVRDRSLETAAAFAQCGIGKGSHVAVFLPNVEEFPLSWLALGRLGAVMVPVNVTYTPREVAYVMGNAHASHLVIHRDLLGIYESIEQPSVPRQRVIVVGDAHPDYAHWPAVMDAARGAQPPKTPVDPDDLVNIQYTSGTTGFPKGCMLSHRYWLLLGKVSREIFATSIARYYAGSSWYYMVPQRMLVNAMASGGAALYVPRKPTARRFMADVRAHRCEYVAVFEAVYKQPPHPDDAKNGLKIASIFALSKENHADFQRRFDVFGQEMYGMTEIGPATHVPAHAIEATTGQGTCGIESPFRQVKIVDDDGRDVPTGSLGEVCVKGPGILHGYYDNRAATDEAFRGPWFRTGDLGRVDRHGYHFIVGRLKDMVRRSGENISAREVEAVLRSMPEIEDAAIVPVPDEVRGEEVKAYIQLMPGQTPEAVPPERILAHCATGLAPFKVPRYIEYRETFPRTDSQRVQKRHLIEEKPDLRTGAYDRMEKRWR
ncbi:MAG: class I adenylate-forming enzyme family protein [Alphaproteobacteria bacterium]